MGIYLALGSNIGNRRNNLKKAIQLLKECGVETLRKSKIHETKAVSKIPQRDFLNQCIEVKTTHRPKKLLQIIKIIEKQMGRKRLAPKKIGSEKPRIIDIDILIYNNDKINSRNLKIPHPRMNERDFVLKPLEELIKL